MTEQPTGVAKQQWGENSQLESRRLGLFLRSLDNLSQNILSLDIYTKIPLASVRNTFVKGVQVGASWA
jgi:hypothetical protein